MTYQAAPSTVGRFFARAYSRWRDVDEPYSEATFGHLLTVERRRAEQSNRAVLLALVSLHSQAGPQRMSAQAGSRIFAGLARTIREVDFTGWYRQGYVAGAVLVQRTAHEQVTTAVEERVRLAVYGHLPAGVREAVRVDVSRVFPTVCD